MLTSDLHTHTLMCVAHLHTHFHKHKYIHNYNTHMRAQIKTIAKESRPKGSIPYLNLHISPAKLTELQGRFPS